MKFLPLVLLPFSASLLDAQIFADFTTTHGDFTCELNYQAAPKTVANFIGLAEGSRPWIDPATGAVVTGTPFYHGVTFHRVIKDFMSQSGSKNGQGTDGPGYSFVDETTNGLIHSSAGVLSMANSGINTNGSQFFITAAATPWLDGLHTVFGTVTPETLSVTQGINQEPTASGDRPVTPIIIHSVSIRRVGAAAEAFDIHAHQLPVASGITGTLKVEKDVETRFDLSEPQPASSIFQVYQSTNLSSWSLLGRLYRDSQVAGETRIIFGNASAPRLFYNIASITYPGNYGPVSTAGRTLIAQEPGYSATCIFNANGNGGTISDTQTPTPAAIARMEFAFAPLGGAWTIQKTNGTTFRITATLDGQTDTHFTGTYVREQGSGRTRGTITLTK